MQLIPAFSSLLLLSACATGAEPNLPVKVQIYGSNDVGLTLEFLARLRESATKMTGFIVVPPERTGESDRQIVVDGKYWETRAGRVLYKVDIYRGFPLAPQKLRTLTGSCDRRFLARCTDKVARDVSVSIG